jgi:hypothetical protein
MCVSLCPRCTAAEYHEGISRRLCHTHWSIVRLPILDGMLGPSELYVMSKYLEAKQQGALTLARVA